MATKTAKAKNAKNNALSAITEVVENVNNFVLETADDVVDATVKSAEQWQEVTAKAIKGGFKLADKQQDIVFTTLEKLKGQLTKSGKRFKQLFSK